MNYKDYKKDYAKLIIGILIMLIGTFWFVTEVNERMVYTHATGIAVSNKDEMSNVVVTYEYGFNIYEGVIKVPEFKQPKMNDEIPVMFDKNNYTVVLYGMDTRLYSIMLSLVGGFLFFYYLIKIQNERTILN